MEDASQLTITLNYQELIHLDPKLSLTLAVIWKIQWAFLFKSITVIVDGSFADQTNPPSFLLYIKSSTLHQFTHHSKLPLLLSKSYIRQKLGSWWSEAETHINRNLWLAGLPRMLQKPTSRLWQRWAQPFLPYQTHMEEQFFLALDSPFHVLFQILTELDCGDPNADAKG